MTWTARDPRPGHWMVRVRRLCPAVAARIWLAHTRRDPHSGEPMERSPFLAAQIGLEIVGLSELWAMIEYVEASPEQQRALTSPPERARAPRNGRLPALLWAPLPKWQQERARRITAAYYAREIAWLQWCQRNRPDHPDFTWRKPVDPKAIPVPKWADKERFA